MDEAVMWLLLAVIVAVVYVVLFEAGRYLGGGGGRPLPRLFAPLVRAVRRSGLAAAVTVGLQRVGILTPARRTEPVPPVLLVLELRRLAAEVQRIEVSDQPHRAARLAAALAAYDSVLVELCAHSDVPTPIGLLPLDPRARLGLETDLVATGVDW